MIEHYYHPELIRFAFVFGIVVSMFFYERRQLTTGGVAVPGYLAFGIFDPMILPAVFLVASLSYLTIHKGLARLMLLPNAIKFSLTILVSAGIHLVLDIFVLSYGRFDANSSLLRGIGYVVPGLVAHEFSRHGIGKTAVNIGLASAIVALALAGLIAAFPDLSRLSTSSARDVFPINLAYLPLLVFLSLVAWLGVVRLHGLRCGGILGGAVLTLLVLQPQELLRFLVAALLTLVIVRRLLDPFAILFGRRRFAAHMLVGACLSWFAFRLSELYFDGGTISVLTPSLSVMGILLTGLLASDMDHIGIGPTLLGVCCSVTFTLVGVLLVLEAASYQRLAVMTPLLALFLAGSALMATPPERLPWGAGKRGNAHG